MKSKAPSDPTPLKSVAGRTSFAYTDEGQGPTIVAIHGLPGSLRDFRWLAPCVTPGARFVRIDLPGFGQSPAATEVAASIDENADFVLRAIEALRLSAPVLLGHSMGGAIAIAAAHSAPERFSGLALLASPGVRTHRHLRRVPVRPLSRLFRNRLPRRLFAPVVGLFARQAGFSRSTPPAALYRSIDIASSFSVQDNAERIAALMVPCLVAFAGDDVLVEAQVGEELASACPEGPRLRFATGGHNIQKTQAVELGQELVAWTRQLSPRARAG